MDIIIFISLSLKIAAFSGSFGSTSASLGRHFVKLAASLDNCGDDCKRYTQEERQALFSLGNNVEQAG